MHASLQLQAYLKFMMRSFCLGKESRWRFTAHIYASLLPPSPPAPAFCARRCKAAASSEPGPARPAGPTAGVAPGGRLPDPESFNVTLRSCTKGVLFSGSSSAAELLVVWRNGLGPAAESSNRPRSISTAAGLLVARMPCLESDARGRVALPRAGMPPIAAMRCSMDFNRAPK